VKAFDVQALAAQLETIGARYFVITLGQNSGFFNSPNATYDRITGYAPGERCSTRDLPLDLVRALEPKGVKLLLYLPCQTPNPDARAQKAFGIHQGAGDQPIDLDILYVRLIPDDEAGARESITWRIPDESVRVRSARGSRSRSSVRFRRCCWPGAGHEGRKRRLGTSRAGREAARRFAGRRDWQPTR